MDSVRRMKTVTDKRQPSDITPSIVEEAMTRFSESDDSLAKVVEEQHIEVRDFMILSIICDQGSMSLEQLGSVLGLSKHSIADCVSRLMIADLVAAETSDNSQTASDRAVPTHSGRILTRRILGASNNID